MGRAERGKVPCARSRHVCVWGSMRGAFSAKRRRSPFPRSPLSDWPHRIAPLRTIPRSLLFSVSRARVVFEHCKSAAQQKGRRKKRRGKAEGAGGRRGKRTGRGTGKARERKSKDGKGEGRGKRIEGRGGRREERDGRREEGGGKREEKWEEGKGRREGNGAKGRQGQGRTGRDVVEWHGMAWHHNPVASHSHGTTSQTLAVLCFALERFSRVSRVDPCLAPP